MQLIIRLESDKGCEYLRHQGEHAHTWTSKNKATVFTSLTSLLRAAQGISRPVLAYVSVVDLETRLQV